MNLILLRATSTSLIALSLVAIAGCSSSSASGGGSTVTDDGATAAAFSPFCTATLSNDAELMG
jgi:hypothetical protein